MTEIDLTPLKDIHIPASPPSFPPAAGWWIIIGILLMITVCGGIILYFWYQSPKRYALYLLKNIKSSSVDLQTKGVELSTLLKRVALVAFPREEVAALTDREWAKFLMNHGDNALSREQSDFLASVAYLPKQKAVAIDAEKLYTAVQKWIYYVLSKG